jgi:hypothetical protein
MSLQETIILISGIAALVAAAASVWAARAAHQSAMNALESARHTEKLDRRGILRDLITTCHRLIAASGQIVSVIEELKASTGSRYFLRPIRKFQREVSHPTGGI